ncbi:MAG TPA: L-threonine 3-dehydrogenase [Actinomycetota bacterium]|nr:L-threonine 3-dehydrogenase [Actinomycetota bacterium]
MRALRKVRPAPGAELVEVPVPRPGPTEVLVRVEAASICGTDLHIYRWDPWAASRVRPPLTFGHEVTGTVAAAGADVAHLPPGTRVAAETHLFCGHCPACRRGQPHICRNLRILGVDVDGAFAEFVLLPAANAWTVDERIPPEVASVLEPFGNAVHAALGSAGGGDLATATVAVIGCGPIGLFAVGVARAAGARTVVAVEPNPLRLDLAKRMGADVVVDPSSEDPVEAALLATGGLGVDVVLEMSGVPEAVRQGTRMLAPGGRMSLLGLPTGPVSLDLTDQIIFKEARLQGVTGRELFRTWEQTTTLVATGMVDVTPVITHRFPLERFAEAFDVVASGQAGKVVLQPPGG